MQCHVVRMSMMSLLYYSPLSCISLGVDCQYQLNFMYLLMRVYYVYFVVIGSLMVYVCI